MPASLTDAQIKTTNLMARLGFHITHHYSDGVINMEDEAGNMVFVKLDGTVQPPRTKDTSMVHSMMRHAGLTINFP
jgi:hypothetical protein